MNSLNISLSQSMREWIDQQVADGDYGTASEFLRDLIRRTQQAHAQADLEEKLLAGLASPTRELTEKDWENLRRKLRENAPKKKRK